MTDRLTNIIVGLQRMAEEARIKGEDIRYSQRQEDDEHLKYLKDLHAIVHRLGSTLIDEIRKFTPPAEEARLERVNKLPEPDEKPMPKFLQQGPRKEAS
jgi:hypothetical protein